jgi:hypothetical protein
MLFLTDESGKIWALYAGPVADTVNPVFGHSSCNFNGSVVIGEGFISTPADTDFETGSDDFTIDFWIKTTQSLSVPVYQGDGLGQSINHIITINSGIVNWYPAFCVGGYTALSSITAINDGVWYHIAGVRYGDLFSLYVDGLLVASTTLSFSVPYSIQPFCLGKQGDTLNPFAGNIDEFRFSKGVARWTTPFSVPQSAYSMDGYTKILMHFNDLNPTTAHKQKRIFPALRQHFFCQKYYSRVRTYY